jgi:hypothetical protein
VRLPNAPHRAAVRSRVCPAVRRPSSVRERPKTPPSVHRSMPGARITYKGVAAPFALRAEPPAATCARRRLPPWPPPPSRVPASSRGKSTSPTPPLGCTATHRPVYQDQARPARRERQPRRPLSLAAGAPLAGATTVPAKCPNRPPLVPRPLPRPSPAASTGELAEIEQPALATAPRGLHCERKDFSRVLLAKG